MADEKKPKPDKQNLSATSAKEQSKVIPIRLPSNLDAKSKQTKLGRKCSVVDTDYSSSREVLSHLNHMLLLRDSNAYAMITDYGSYKGEYKGVPFKLFHKPNKSCILQIGFMPYFKEDFDLTNELVRAITPLMFKPNPNSKADFAAAAPLLYVEIDEHPTYDDDDQYSVAYIWDIYNPECTVREYCFKYINSLDDVLNVKILQPFYNNKDYFNDYNYLYGMVEFYFSPEFVNYAQTNMTQSELFWHIIRFSEWKEQVDEIANKYRLIWSDSADAVTAENTQNMINHCLAWLWQQTEKFGMNCHYPEINKIPSLTKSQRQWYKSMNDLAVKQLTRLGKGVGLDYANLDGENNKLVRNGKPAANLTAQEKQIKTFKQFLDYMEQARLEAQFSKE